MNRIEHRKKILSEVFQLDMKSEDKTDPEFIDILNNFIFGEVWQVGDLSHKERELLTIALLMTNQTIGPCRYHMQIALNIGAKPSEIKETLYQGAPYIGFPKTLDAVAAANEVFQLNGIVDSFKKATTVTEENRYQEGRLIKERLAFNSDNLNESVDVRNPFEDYFMGFCYGDIYSRGELSLKFRLLISFCILCALGNGRDLLHELIRENLKCGTDKTDLLAVLTHCLPYIGFPKTFDALTILKTVLAAKEFALE